MPAGKFTPPPANVHNIAPRNRVKPQWRYNQQWSETFSWFLYGVRNILPKILWGAKHVSKISNPQFFARFYIFWSAQDNRPFIFISGAGWVTILFPLPKRGSCSIISLGKVTSNSIQDHPKANFRNENFFFYLHSWSLTSTRAPVHISSATIAREITWFPTITLREWPIIVAIRGRKNWFFGRKKVVRPV